MVHSTAVVAAGARLGRGVVIGPYCVIGNGVEIGDGTRLAPHAVIDGWTKIGKSNEIGVGAVIGVAPQDRDYAGARSYVTIGDRNVVREYVTIHRANDPEGITSVGNDNFIMALSHVAHNCRLGNDITIANYAGLSGHIVVEDHVVLGGLTAFHQHIRIGAYAMVGGGVRVGQDVVPFAMASGDPFRVYGLNRVGLRRHGFSAERQRMIKSAFRVLFWSGLTFSDAIVRLGSEMGKHEDVARIVKFAEGSARGLAPGISVGTRDGSSERDGEER